MAIQKIEYQNKVSIQDDPAVAEINKVTDSNMNEIKSVVNNNADETALKEVLANKVTTISNTSTDTQYPSAKCVYDIVGDLETILETLDTGSGV